MTKTISVMISSTVRDLVPQRRAVAAAIDSTGLAEIVGIDPGSTPAVASSSYEATTSIARDCDCYVLILGGRYGYKTEFGKSATELEFDAAYRDDPTKVIILRNASVRSYEPAQSDFIRRVEDYHRGFLVSRFRGGPAASRAALHAFRDWLVERAAVGKRFDYFDHFIRIASQRSPFPGARSEYRLTTDRVEITYRVLGRVYSVHFDKAQLYGDFWGSVVHLDQRFEEWRHDNFGRGI